MSLNRREFIGIGGAAVAGMALAPGLRLIELARARPPEEAVTRLQRWGLLVDVSKCNDCDACVTACHEENGVTSHGRPATDAQWIRKVALKDKQSGYVTTLPVMCQHCEEPPCVDVCPTGASFKRADGIGPQAGPTDHPRPSRGRSRRIPRVPSRRSAGQGGPLPPPAV